MNDTNFLELRALYKHYAAQPLLCGVSLTVARGEIVCLLGPSGSGKTTLLRLIAGLETPERGEIYLEGQDITNIPPQRRGIGLMFQEYALFPHRTVAENIAFGLRMQRLPRAAIAAQVAATLELVGLADFGARDIHALSGGERQRVALARSLAPRPRILLLDEPMGALDRNLRTRLLEELPAILRRVGVTAISVTHDQEEAFALADQVVLLHEGRVVQTGTPAAVYDAPVTAWVAHFLGFANLFPATVTAPQQVQTALGLFQVSPAVPLPCVGTTGAVLIHTWGLHLQAGPTNSFIAQVHQRTFHGEYYRLTLALPGGTLHHTAMLTATLPAVAATINGWIDPAALRWINAAS